jgi:hypothetical protein
MREQTTGTEQPELLDVVALLADVPSKGLRRGQVGTVVEVLDSGNVLVEFSDDAGRAYSIAPYATADLLRLRYSEKAA